MKQRKKNTLAERLNDFPPIFCRLLARHHYSRPLTTEEIARRSAETPGVQNQLNPSQVATFSESTDWKGIPILDALAFLHGCRVDLTNTQEFRRINSYLLKKPMFKYLRSSPDWKTEHLPRFVKWRKSHGIIISSSMSPPIRKLLVRLTPILDESHRHAARQKDDLVRTIMRTLEPDQAIEPAPEAMLGGNSEWSQKMTF